MATFKIYTVLVTEMIEFRSKSQAVLVLARSAEDARQTIRKQSASPEVAGGWRFKGNALYGAQTRANELIEDIKKEPHNKRYRAELSSLLTAYDLKCDLVNEIPALIV